MINSGFPLTLSTPLPQLFSKFDTLVAEAEVYKVETVGAVYMVAAGVPVTSEDHTQRLALLALRFAAAGDGFSFCAGRQLSLRMGLHTGQVIGGIIGLQLPRCAAQGGTAARGARGTSAGRWPAR